MKNLVIVAALALTFFSFKASPANALGDIVSALKEGNPSEVSHYFDSFIDIKLPSKEEAKNISKNQATQTLKDFYSNQNIKGFDLTSQRELGGTGYLTGKLKAESRSFNVTIMVKTKGGNSNIVSVRIN